MSEWETYWTAGYTVTGASDVIVNRYCRTEKEAHGQARAGSIDDAARLLEVGVPVEITIWVEKWRTRRVDERDPRAVVDVERFAARSGTVER